MKNKITTVVDSLKKKKKKNEIPNMYIFMKKQITKIFCLYFICI